MSIIPFSISSIKVIPYPVHSSSLEVYFDIKSDKKVQFIDILKIFGVNSEYF